MRLFCKACTTLLSLDVSRKLLAVRQVTRMFLFQRCLCGPLDKDIFTSKLRIGIIQDMKTAEKVATGVLRSIIVLLLLTILFVSAWLITKLRPDVVQDPQDKFPIFYLVWLAALLGSALNITIRPSSGAVPTGFLDTITYTAWKLLVAMTFATLLYVVFASELISGDTFPKFVNVKDTDYMYPLRFLNDCKPATNQDAAKMLVWAFIAGYLERFVPNIISRIQHDSTEHP